MTKTEMMTICEECEQLMCGSVDLDFAEKTYDRHNELATIIDAHYEEFYTLIESYGNLY